ncbi:MAG: hypothetical protein HFK08_03910 [Clostridia bacterium]|jgi:4-hydroxybenzoate polyprenyltransferase|nr:hypothetical protein [Clostridia bacterium]
MAEKFKNFLGFVGGEIKQCVISKSYGCFVALAACALTLAQTFAYPFVSGELFSAGVIVSSVLGVVLFAALSLFRKTSSLAPIALMICDFLALIFFAGADGIVDVFSTLFFDGFSIGKIFRLPVAEWFCLLSFILSFVISSVAVYLPQNKKEAVTENPHIEQEEVKA